MPEIQHPIERQIDRIAALQQAIASGDPVDYSTHAKMQVLDIAEAGVYFSRLTLDEAERVDREADERMRQADETIL